MAAKTRTGTKRLTPQARARVGARAAKLYAGGKSVRDVAQALNWSYGATHRLLREQNVTMRGRGAAGAAGRVTP